MFSIAWRIIGFCYFTDFIKCVFPCLPELSLIYMYEPHKSAVSFLTTKNQNRPQHINQYLYEQKNKNNFDNFLLQIAEEVLAMSISLTPDQILDLAQKINITIQGLQNIDDILAETSSDLARAKGLKERAETAEWVLYLEQLVLFICICLYNLLKEEAVENEMLCVWTSLWLMGRNPIF